MSDYSSASITIGGTLSRALLGAFLAAITSDGLCIDYGERVLDGGDIVSGERLAGVASFVHSGEFSETEAFCRQHGLRYIRWSDACVGAWDASIEIFTGSGAVDDFAATPGGVVVLTLEDIHRLGSLAAIEAHFAAADFDPGPLVLVDP